MNLERLRWGEWIAGIAALNLALVTFRSWYTVTGTDLHVSAWDALDNGRYLLIATAVVGLFLLLVVAAEAQLSFPPGALAAIVGLACTVYVAYRLATPPADVLEADVGLYIGLACALGVAIGGLLSARDASAETAYEPPPVATSSGDPAGAMGPLVPDQGGSGGTWSPAPPAPTAGWTPAPPAPPATAAGAAARPLQAGDDVVLTAGGARFPAGTSAQVVEVFAGGALVEVVAADGVAERFEVPQDAYERPGAASPAGGESWSPAMPAATEGAPAGGEDWGFDEPGGAVAAGAAGVAAGAALGGDDGEPAKEKVPFWKREIGGGKKKKAAAEEATEADALAAAPVADGEEQEQKPGFFKRMFGGGKAAEADTAVAEPEAEPTPATDVAGVGAAAESDTAVTESASEPEQESVVDEPAAAPREPEVVIDSPEPEPEPVATEPEVVIDSAPEPEPEPEADAPEPEPEPEPAAPEPEAAAPEPEPAAPEPESSGSGPAAGAGAGAAAAAAAAAAGDGEAEQEPKPKRKRSSGSRKVPAEAVAAAADEGGPPKVGDSVQLKVSGGKYDAGTRGTVVDVFSAGVIVEMADDSGKTERLDLPFEAVGPADA